MAVSPEYKTFVLELLEPLGPVRIRAMFGAGGVYYDKLMFGLIFDETLYLKADEINRPDFEAENKGPFVYEPQSGKLVGRQIAMPYWEVPEHLYDEPDELLRWARGALDAAFRAERAKSPKRKKKPAKAERR